LKGLWPQKSLLFISRSELLRLLGLFFLIPATETYLKNPFIPFHPKYFQ
jgi:hypothetical protein